MVESECHSCEPLPSWQSSVRCRLPTCMQAFPDYHVFIGLNAGAKGGSGKGLRVLAERYLQVSRQGCAAHHGVTHSRTPLTHLCCTLSMHAHICTATGRHPCLCRTSDVLLHAHKHILMCMQPHHTPHIPMLTRCLQRHPTTPIQACHLSLVFVRHEHCTADKPDQLPAVHSTVLTHLAVCRSAMLWLPLWLLHLGAACCLLLPMRPLWGRPWFT